MKHKIWERKNGELDEWTRAAGGERWAGECETEEERENTGEEMEKPYGWRVLTAKP